MVYVCAFLPPRKSHELHVTVNTSGRLVLERDGLPSHLERKFGAKPLIKGYSFLLDDGISEERATSSCTGGSDRAIVVFDREAYELIFVHSFVTFVRRIQALRGKGHIFLYRRFG